MAVTVSVVQEVKDTVKDIKDLILEKVDSGEVAIPEGYSTSKANSTVARLLTTATFENIFGDEDFRAMLAQKFSDKLSDVEFVSQVLEDILELDPVDEEEEEKEEEKEEHLVA